MQKATGRDIATAEGEATEVPDAQGAVQAGTGSTRCKEDPQRCKEEPQPQKAHGSSHEKGQTKKRDPLGLFTIDVVDTVDLTEDDKADTPSNRRP